MLSLKYFEYVFFAIFFMLASLSTRAKVLELGESQLSGKKDQPEAMTFVARSPLDLSGAPSTIKLSQKIKKDIKKDIFKVAKK